MPDPIIIDKGAARKLNVVGEQLTVLATGDQTGSYEVFHQAGPEGTGAPPHHHPWDEAFYVIRGEVAFGVGDREALAQPGTFVHVPAGATHWFHYGPGGGEMISLTSRGGAAKMFTDFDCEIVPDKPNLGKLVEIAARHEATVAIPPG
ncbi:MAG TPA: cupin domain-containing protein [Caulobacteraceae bacterium]|jgi:quercetin dioxygenase-like cupin family protein